MESKDQKIADIVILGAGLTGLTLHYLLKDLGLNIQIVEARNRLGGRIHTIYEHGQVDTGATWLGRHHIALQQLLDQLGIGVYPQVLGDQAIYEPISTSPPQLVKLPPNNDPSYRIKGGSSAVINHLSSYLDSSHLHLNTRVIAIKEETENIIIQTDQQILRARRVISTLPPKLLIATIQFSPGLPTDFENLAHRTHTWMGESIKVGLTYGKPFWNTIHSSGTIFSNVGPITEMYDHSNDAGNNFSLKGFFNNAYYTVTQEERKTMVLDQLRKYFGSTIDEYLQYHECVWRNEIFTYSPYEEHVLPHQNNGQPGLRKSFYDDKLFIAGSETATAHPGYMEGAVQSAIYVSELIKKYT